MEAGRLPTTFVGGGVIGGVTACRISDGAQVLMAE